MATKKVKDDWMQQKWRPAMGWMYMAVCVMDFVAFPILWSLLQALTGGNVSSQWLPLTLQGAGLFHMAMGAVLGVAAWGRTQEKILDKAETAQPKQPIYAQHTIYAQQPQYSAPAPQAPVAGYGGKLAPPQTYQPEL